MRPLAGNAFLRPLQNFRRCASLSRGLVLVKWWLLALPHYLVVAVFAGGAWASWSGVGMWGDATSGGLIGLLFLLLLVIGLLTSRRKAREKDAQ